MPGPYIAQTAPQCNNQAAQGGSIMEKQPNSRICFVCGIENPIGLHLAFTTDDEGRCTARFRPSPEHQGYPGQLHGGIISTLLDVPTQSSVYLSVLAG
jgi:acyl-coenzyme A thioesterase PaaI-like protein